MNAAIIVRPEASRDAADAAHWYEDRSTGLGSKFIDAVDKSFILILESPHKYPVYFQTIRRSHVRRFPYAIFFVPDHATVVVLAILHLNRDPRLIRRILRQR